MGNGYNGGRSSQTPAGGGSGAPRKKKKKTSAGQIVGRIALVLFTLCIIGVLTIAIFFKIFMTYVNTSLLPSLETETQELTLNLASTIYYQDNESGEWLPLETLHVTGGNRELVTYDQIPEHLINALVSIEDHRFCEHSGVDWRTTLNAVRKLFSGGSGGGSTLTQQLIKNITDENDYSILRKVREIFTALNMEKKYSKQQILEAYLNVVNYGGQCQGVEAAAQTYFGKSIGECSLAECALIAGITQNPSKYNPISGQEANAEKRKTILQYMFDQGMITKEEQEVALADDVYSRIQTVDTTYKATSTPYSYFTDELTQQVKDTLMEKLGYTETQAHNLLYSGGLQIYTTQDPAIQKIVDEEVNNPDNYTAKRYSAEYRLSITHGNGTTEHYSERDMQSWHKNVLGDSHDGLYDSEEEVQADVDSYKAWLLKEDDTIIGESLTKILQPQVSFVLMDQKTGYVKAISGGRGAKTANLTLNRATNTPRQPGSTFKVISAFAPALDTCGATLGTVYYDSVYSVGNKTFNNWYGQKYTGYSSIRDGIIYSMNIVAVRCLMETVSPQLGLEYAENFGITTLTSQDLGASQALGGLTHGTTNLELTAAYASIANEGIYTRPVFFTKILDHDGKILINNEPETHRVLKDSTAFLLTDAMAGSMETNRKFGSSINSTSARANIPGMSNAGKSGTTSKNNDIWFVGYTPYYTAGIWAGCDSNQKLTAQNGGTSFTKNIWRNIMTRVHENLSDPGFTIPDSVETAQICRKSGKLAIPGVCTEDPRGNAVYTEYFAKGTVPSEMCNTHVRATVCAETGLLPGDSCPRTVLIRIALPADANGTTDDSPYALPTEQCPGHTSIPLPLTPDGPGSSEFQGPGGSLGPVGPGYVNGGSTVSSPTGGVSRGPGLD